MVWRRNQGRGRGEGGYFAQCAAHLALPHKNVLDVHNQVRLRLEACFVTCVFLYFMALKEFPGAKIFRGGLAVCQNRMMRQLQSQQPLHTKHKRRWVVKVLQLSCCLLIFSCNVFSGVLCLFVFPFPIFFLVARTCCLYKLFCSLFTCKISLLEPHVLSTLIFLMFCCVSYFSCAFDVILFETMNELDRVILQMQCYEPQSP